jgi:hypothetical protein
MQIFGIHYRLHLNANKALSSTGNFQPNDDTNDSPLLHYEEYDSNIEGAVCSDSETSMNEITNSVSIF